MSQQNNNQFLLTTKLSIPYSRSDLITRPRLFNLLQTGFRGYGVRGTVHPENYPFGLRQLMSIIPFFSALTQKSNMQRASAVAKALMFSAGEASTNICSLLAASYAWLSGIPGGSTLFVVTICWDLVSSITVAIIPRGDYAKAIRALRNAPERNSSSTFTE